MKGTAKLGFAPKKNEIPSGREGRKRVFSGKGTKCRKSKYIYIGQYSQRVRYL